MRQTVSIFIFLALLWLSASDVRAQASFAQLSGLEQAVTLDWRNRALDFEFHLPPEPGPASLTVVAKPSSTLPVDGSYFLLSVNQHPALPFSPNARGFSARFDIPKDQLRAGGNRIELIFVSGKQQPCLREPDGGWTINMHKSRFDIALNRPQPKLSQFEDWLSADIGAPRLVAIEQGPLSFAAYQEFGAFVMQGLGLRMNNIPQITADSSQADLVIRPKRTTPNGISLHLDISSTVPALVFRASDDNFAVLAGKWFAQNRITNRFSSKPLHEWPASQLMRPEPLQQLLAKSSGSAWRTQTRPTSLRLPPATTARLQMEVPISQIIGSALRLQLNVDNKQIKARPLFRAQNNLSFELPVSQSAARTVSIISDMAPPLNGDATCPLDQQQMQTGPTRISLLLAGIDALSALDRLAWNGGVFTAKNGKDTQILLPFQKGEVLFQGWRVLARLAKLRNKAMVEASFGGEPNLQQNVLYIGSLASIPLKLQNKMPKSFAVGAGRAPVDPARKYRNPLIQSAMAAPPNTPAIGIAGVAKLPNSRVWMALSTSAKTDQAQALQQLVDGKALDRFSGTVVRWQGDLVAVNATNTNLPLPFIGLELSWWNILTLILLPTGLWSVVYLVKAHSERKFTRL